MARKREFVPGILATARDKLGFESLRLGQEAAIRSILDEHDTLVVQPTGSGRKSAAPAAMDNRPR